MLKNYNIGSWLLLVLLCGSIPGVCQEFPPETYQLKYFGTKDGLASRIAYNSSVDTTGILWSGTTGGLCRINGYGITGFDKFPQTFQGTMCRDGNGWLYVRKLDAQDSVEVINPATLEVWGARFNDRLRGVFGGIAQRNGQPLYFAQGSIVHEYRPGKQPRQVHLLSSEIREGDKLIAASDEGFFLYRGNNGVVEELRGGQVSSYTLPLNKPPQHLYVDGGGNLWCSTDQETVRKAPDGDFVHFNSSLSGGGTTNFFAEDDFGNIFFGHLDPLLLRITYLEQIIDGVRATAKWILEVEDRILSISGEDFRRGIRLNTYGGIYALDFCKHPESPFRRFLYEDKLPGKFGKVMRGFAADDEGRVYTNQDSQEPYWFRVDPESGALDTITMLKNDGSVVQHWGCGTNLLNYQGDIYGQTCDLDSLDNFLGFVYRYRPRDDTWKRWPLPDAGQVVRWITNGRTDNELLLITEENTDHEEGRLYYFYPARDSIALIQTAGPVNAVRGYTNGAAYDEKRKSIWFGTDNALYCFGFDTEELRSYTFAGERPTFITDVLLRSDGTMLLSTLQAGLQSFDPETGQFKKVGGHVAEGQLPPNSNFFLELPTDDVATLNLTKENDLLLTTFDGLILHGSGKGETSIFTTDDGLGSDEFNTASIFYNSADNRWYAGGVNGFVSFATNDLATSPSHFNPAILSCRILDKRIGYETFRALPSAPREALVLSPAVVYFTIDFTIPDYFPRGDRRYQTKLVGFDPDWSAPTTTNSVRYTDLKPGDYTFLVRAFDGEGRLGSLERSMTIVVLKPFYYTWWFIFLSALLVMAFFYWLHRRRMARLREKLEGERKVQSLELRSLRQQVNPHFISNAMNAIKEYIQRPDAPDPARYLTDFSQMMRSFLESSRHRFTSIADEVDMLKRYVNLEQLRYPDKFDVEFNVDHRIDPEMDEVPTLLLQPIVENAIQHGLRPIAGKGLLRVSFDLDPLDDDIIICTVSDNGVGRQLAAREANGAGHISRASAILEERRALLASDEEIKLGVCVEDLYPELEHTGTVVTLRIEAV